MAPTGFVMRLFALACAILLALLPGAVARADGPHAVPELRVGVLEFGTVGWEIDTVQRLGLARKHGIRLDVVPLASENAMKVALLSGKVDLIVSDWFWVATLRSHDQDYQFVPYSKAVGEVVANPKAGIKSLADLAGKRLGVAGGPVDKSWLIARAYARKAYGIELGSAAKPQFAAAPLLNHLMLDGELPAAINFWQYSARLVAQGMRPVITVAQMLKGLGVKTDPPLLGWVFSQRWAQTHGDTLRAFIAATYDAKQVLANSDAAWQPLRSKVKPENDAVFAALRQGYRDGVVDHFGAPEIQAAGQLFQLVAKESHGQLTGGMRELPPDVFWSGFRRP
ncbi:MAG TPA: ABC transporter substrate-binding protein [Rhodanobacteraceae bacterium]|nr:ABC transporter substrate-binding protein [Rhodanobacteraceae bacterium]